MLQFLSYLIFSAHASSASPWQDLQSAAQPNSIEVNGRIVPEDGAQVTESARVPGRVVAILKREGELAKVGTALYEISSQECTTLAQEEKIAMQSHLPDLVESSHEREKQLGIKIENQKCLLLATHPGVITKRSLESGSAFNAGDPACTLLDTHHLSIELELPERDFALVKPGDKVKLQFATGPARKYESKVRAVLPNIDPITRSVKVKLQEISFSEQVSIDALVQGEILTHHKLSAIKVPTSALVFNHNQQFIVVGSSEKPRALPISILSEQGEEVSIRPLGKESILPTDQVLTRGAIFIFQKLKNEG